MEIWIVGQLITKIYYSDIGWYMIEKESTCLKEKKKLGILHSRILKKWSEK